MIMVSLSADVGMSSYSSCHVECEVRLQYHHHTWKLVPRGRCTWSELILVAGMVHIHSYNIILSLGVVNYFDDEMKETYN